MQIINYLPLLFQTIKINIFICLLYCAVMALSSAIRLAKMLWYLLFHFLGSVMFIFLLNVMVTERLPLYSSEVCALNTSRAGWRVQFIPCGKAALAFWVPAHTPSCCCCSGVTDAAHTESVKNVVAMLGDTSSNFQGLIILLVSYVQFPLKSAEALHANLTG